MRQIQKASANISVDVYIIDSTTGEPELGVLFNTAGMDLEYRRDSLTVVDVTEVTLASLTTAHTDGGFLEIGHGLYRFDVPDAAFVTGASKVSVQGTVTGMIILPQTIQLVDFDPEDSVRMGLTSLPNAATGAAGGLPVSDAGGLDLDALNTSATRLTAARAQVLDDWINSGRLDAILDSRMAEASINTTTGAVDLVTNVFNNVGITQAGADRVWLSTVRQLSANGLDLILVGSTFVFALIKGIWDRVLTGATHNINNSAGRKLRQVGVMVLTSGTAQAGSANTITLATTDSTTDNIYQGDRVVITGGTGQEEHGIITGYIGATRVATMSKNWTITPDNTSEYELSVATVDVESWGHAPATVSATTQKPEVDAASISDSSTAADNLETNIPNLDVAVSSVGGGGGTSDWTLTEKEQFRSACGIDGAKTPAVGGQLQAIPTTPMRGTDGANTVVPLAAASTATQAKQDTAQADLDALTGADGAVLATLQPNYAPNTQTPLTAAEVNAEVDTALNTAIPGSPATNSINERLASVDDAVTEPRMSELDAGTTGKMANQVDLVKTEADKIANVDAGAGVSGSVIEEVENIVDNLGARVPAAQTGAPSTYDGLIYFIRESMKNQLRYNKSTDVMVLFEDDGATPKLTHSMTDDATEATRGAGT